MDTISFIQRDYINLRCKHRQERYVIFNSLYQSKTVTDGNDFFMDGAF